MNSGTEQKKKLTAALLLNAFVMPGSGHILIGENFKGYGIAISILIFIFYPLIKFFATMLQAARNMPFMPALTKSWDINKDALIYCLLGVVLLWVYSIIDIVIKRRKAGTLTI